MIEEVTFVRNGNNLYYEKASVPMYIIVAETIDAYFCCQYTDVSKMVSVMPVYVVLVPKQLVRNNTR